MSSFVAGGCSFTFGNELSDDFESRYPSKKTWAYGLYEQSQLADNYVCCARGGIGNQAIARNVFETISHSADVKCVAVMWTFISRYDWAMPPHAVLEKNRWASITPWETDLGDAEAESMLKGNSVQQKIHKQRQQNFEDAGVRPFANSLYKYAANDYHETYLSWKSIIWLQNILDKKKIPYFFTLSNNGVFYNQLSPRQNEDNLLTYMYKELDFDKWFSFGERMMGFDQWALLNDYQRGTTHPLDEAHQDAVKLMLPEFTRIIGEK